MTRSVDELPPPPKTWAGRSLVALFGGPIDPLTGRWFFTDDWDQQVRAAQYMADRGQRGTRALNYQPTGRTVDHPTHTAVGDQWTYEDNT